MVLSEIKLWLSQEKIKQASILASAALAVVALSVLLKTCYDNQVISNHETEVKAEILEKKSEADSKAAEARASDSISINKKSEERKDAISKATDEAPSDADIALNCHRLREAGYATSRLPSCRGH